MNILHVIPSLHIRYGGPSYAVKSMVEYQRLSGMKADIVTTHQNADEDESNDDSVVSFRSYFGEYKYSYSLSRWLARNIKRYDVIHIHSLFCFSSFVAGSMARRAGVPYILRPLGQFYPWAIRNKSVVLKKIYLFVFEKKTIYGASALHFTTDHEASQSVFVLPEDKTYVLPLGVETAPKFSRCDIDLSYPELSSKKICLALSRLHQKKGLHLLIPWMSHFLKRGSDWVLVIAGSGDESYQRALVRLARQNGISDKVFFLGDVRGVKKQILLQSCSVFVLPSQSENFGIAVAEALAAGAPVLISDQVGIAADIIKSQSGLVFALNQSSFTSQFARFYDNPSFHRTCAENARKFARNSYDWVKITKEQISLYEKTIMDARAV